MSGQIRKYIGIGYILLSIIAVVATPSGGRAFTVLGLVILAMFLLGVGRLFRAILGSDRKLSK